MADISKISVNEETYNIKDSVARQSQEELTGKLGLLAYKDQAIGTITPTGSVTAPSVDVTPTTKSVNTVNSVGTLPSWSANVSNETLSFSFEAGSLPSVASQTVVTGIASASASVPVFKGTSSTVTVS